MSVVYPELPAVDADMRGILAYRKQLDKFTHDVFQAWTEFTALNAQLEKAAVREVVSEANKDNQEFRDSLKLLQPPRENANDSFFVCMIPVLQQLQYTEQPETVSGMRTVLATLLGLSRDTSELSRYDVFKQRIQGLFKTRAQQPWELYLTLALDKKERISEQATKEELIQFVQTQQHGANLMTLRLFSETLQIKFLILSTEMAAPSEADKAMMEDVGFYLTCLGSTQTAAQKYVLLNYSAASNHFSIYYTFQAGGSRRYLFELNRLPAKLLNAYMKLCEQTDEITDFEKAAPQLLLSSSTQQSWAAQAGKQ